MSLCATDEEKEQLREQERIFWALGVQARELWLQIGRRLVVGQERYGGFKFGEYDLDQMAKEELEDFLVYICAKTFYKENHESEGPTRTRGG